MRNVMSRFITLPILVQLLVIILNREYTQVSGMKLRNVPHESTSAFSPVHESVAKSNVKDDDDLYLPTKRIDGPYLVIKPKPNPTKPEKPKEPTKPEKPKEPTKPEKPKEPTKPDKPKEPTKPEKPKPSKPNKPKPLKPNKPKPSKPNKPKPSKPNKPKPSKPNKPKPTKPDKPKDPSVSEEKIGCTTNECFCNDYYDMVILAESSTFSGSEIWMQTFKPFFKALASKFKVSKENVHLALVLYASYAEEYVSFVDPESSDKPSLLAKIDDISESDIGKTHNVLYVDSLLYALDDMLFEDGTRNDAGKVSILFNYGYDNDKNNKLIPDVVEAYKEKNVHLLTIGMENNLNGNNNMYLLTGCQDNSTECPATIIVEYEHIYSAAREMKVKVCKSTKIANALANKA